MSTVIASQEAIVSLRKCLCLFCGSCFIINVSIYNQRPGPSPDIHCGFFASFLIRGARHKVRCSNTKSHVTSLIRYYQNRAHFYNKRLRQMEHQRVIVIVSRNSTKHQERYILVILVNDSPELLGFFLFHFLFGVNLIIKVDE